MRIVWDERKRMSTIARRGCDFEDVDEEFLAKATITPARQGRFRAIGDINGATVTVIFRPLGTEAVSIISMRRASRKERRRS